MKKILLLPCLLMLWVFTSCKDDPDPALDVSQTKVEVPNDGGNANVTITSNVDWTAVSAATDWCTVAPASGSGDATLKITAQPNTLLSEKTTTVTVTAGALVKTIEVKQPAAALRDVLVGNWQLTAQNSGDPNYNDMVGSVLTLNDNGNAVINMAIDVPGLGIVEQIAGTWSLTGQTINLNGDLAGTPVVLSFVIGLMTETQMSCSMKLNLPGLLPADGLPVVFAKK